MENERLDLTPLDPTLDQLSYERRVRRVMDAAAGELARRARANPFALLADWARPTLAAAAIVTIMAVGALALTEPSSGASEDVLLVEGLGLESSAADWLDDETEPTEMLVFAMERR